MKKPNFWLYFAGVFFLLGLAMVCVYFGTVHSRSGCFLLAGAFSAYGGNLLADYNVQKMDYWRATRDQEVQE